MNIVIVILFAYIALCVLPPLYGAICGNGLNIHKDAEKFTC